GSVRFWNFANGAPQDAFQLSSPILDLDINPKNTMVIAGREDGTLTIIDPNIKRIVYDFNFNNGAINTVKFHPNGEWLSIGTKEGRIRTWKAKTSLLESGPRHNAEVFNFAISSDGKVMVSVSEDSTARISRAETGRETHVLKHPDWVEDVAFSPDNSWFVTVSDDKIVRVFETATGVEKMRMYHSSFVQKVKVSPNGHWILTTGYDQTARLWDSHTGALVLEASLDGIGSALLFSQDGKQMIVGDRSGNITIWDISSL
ncbi:MAG: WD40 repeat domain-containing protein, partial [Anaerolineales bacterium]